MSEKKKGKKGKKGKKNAAVGPQPFTTVQIIQDRSKMLCPRMGDYYSKTMDVETILEVFATVQYTVYTLFSSKYCG